MKRAIQILSVLLPLGAGACGEIASDDYQGEPAAHLLGEIRGDLGAGEVHAPHLGVVWIHFDPTEENELVVGEVTPISVSEFPANVEFDVFDPPPESVANALEGADGEPSGLVAIGLIVAMDDSDEDGQFTIAVGELSGGDLIFGVSYTNYLLYVFDPPAADASLFNAEPFLTNGEAATPGFHVGHNVCIRHDTGEVIPGEEAVDLDELDEQGVFVTPHYEIADDSPIRIYLVEPVDHFPKEGEQPGCDIV